MLADNRLNMKFSLIYDHEQSIHIGQAEVAGFRCAEDTEDQNEDRESMPLKMQMPFRDISRLLFSEYSKGWYVFTVFQDRYIEKGCNPMQKHEKHFKKMKRRVVRHLKEP